jgi:hypothetical protein
MSGKDAQDGFVSEVVLDLASNEASEGLKQLLSDGDGSPEGVCAIAVISIGGTVVRYATKRLLNAVKENPKGVFRAVLRGVGGGASAVTEVTATAISAPFVSIAKLHNEIVEGDDYQRNPPKWTDFM